MCRDVDLDRIARLEKADRPARRRLGADVPDAGPCRAARETAIGNQGNLVVEPDALDGRGGGEHLLHPRPAARPFIANHHHVARFHLPGDDPGVGVRLRLEDDRRAGMPEHFRADARRLDHGPLRSQVAVEDRQAALLAVGIFDFPDAVVGIETEIVGR